jgi:hypothetical protein
MAGQLDARVIGHAYRGLVRWYLGYPAQARADAETAVRAARDLHQPFVLALALMWSYYLHAQLGDLPAAAGDVAEVAAIGDAHGFTFWRGRAKGAQAQLCLDRSEFAEAERLLAESAALLGATGAVRERSWQLTMAARLAVALDRRVDALAHLDEALAAALRTQEQHLLAELHRVRARLLDDDAAAEAALREALAVACRQQAKALELRAATDLARRRRNTGDAAGARALLQPLLDWFTEDADDRSLAVARGLLARLG